MPSGPPTAVQRVINANMATKLTRIATPTSHRGTGSPSSIWRRITNIDRVYTVGRAKSSSGIEKNNNGFTVTNINAALLKPAPTRPPVNKANEGRAGGTATRLPKESRSDENAIVTTTQVEVKVFRELSCRTLNPPTETQAIGQCTDYGTNLRHQVGGDSAWRAITTQSCQNRIVGRDRDNAIATGGEIPSTGKQNY